MTRQPITQTIYAFSGLSQIAVSHTLEPPAGLRSAAERGGFTLIEMVVSLSIMSIVFLAMGSVMVLAGKAVPDPNAPTNLTLDAADVLQQMASELQTATEIAASTDKSIAFKVPDRDGDGIEELLAYFWTGAANSPLTRIYNGGASVQVLSSISEFSLTYDTKSIPQPDALVDSAEIELVSCDSSVNLGAAHVHDDQWWGQYFNPTLPAQAVTWSVTRVVFMAKRDNNALPTTVQLCLPIVDDSQPSSTVIGSAALDAGVLTSSFQWVQVPFASADSLSPGTGLYLTFTNSGGNTAQLRYQNKDVVAPDLALAEGGPVWSWSSAAADQSLLFYAYGTYSTLTPQPPVVRLKSVSLILNAGTSAGSQVRSSVVALNQPEMP